MFKGPADIAVEEVHTILRQIVFRTLESEDCKNLQQYTHLKREIAQTAAATLGAFCTLRFQTMVQGARQCHRGVACCTGTLSMFPRSFPQPYQAGCKAFIAVYTGQ